MKMKDKEVSQSSVVLAQIMLPADTNPAGNVHGGTIMKLIDNAAYVVAARHTGKNAVTASIDRLDFHCPVFIGNLVILKASMNRAGKTSMEVGVRVEAEDLRSGKVRHTASAYLTFVALDDNGRPTTVPGLTAESEEERRRLAAADGRYAIRKAARK
jgi:uncharacterized protein (TIGR00369 family)